LKNISDLREKRIAIIINNDLTQPTQGGIATYTRNLIQAYGDKGFDTWRIGITANDRDAEDKEIIVSKRRISNYRFIVQLFKVAWRLRGQRDWIFHSNRPDQLAPFIILRRRNTLVCTVHGPNREQMLSTKGKMIWSLYQIFEILGLRFADAVIFVNRDTMKFYLSRFPWLGNIAHLVPGGVSKRLFEHGISKEEAKIRLGFDKKDQLFCFVGRLEHEKNVDMIIRAFSKISDSFPKCKLAIAGTGSKKGELEQLVHKLQLDGRVIFLGKLPHEEVIYLMIGSRALILASKWEGSPLVIKEALAVGTNFISTDVGDIMELREKVKIGTVIPEASEDYLAKAMDGILSKEDPVVPRELIRDLGWDNLARHLLGIYTSSIGRLS